MITIRIVGFLFLMLIAGCRVGPRYEPPSPCPPEEWKNPNQPSKPNPFVNFWWEIFNDDTLNDLEVIAVENNPTLYSAFQKVFYARALAGVQAANLAPQLFLNPSYLSSMSLQKLNLPKSLSIPGAPTSIPPFRVHQLQYLLPLNLNYEVDLWGKLHDDYDSALFNAQAQTESFHSSMLILTTDLASSYFQLRSLDAQIDLLKANIDTRLKNFELTKSRFNKGLVTYLDVSQAEVDLANVRASYEDAVRLRQLAENQIAVLTGQFANEFCLEHHPLKNPPPSIQADIPSNVLMQRPDIAKAERTMASQHVLINSAYASFFPTFSLTGALGFSSPDLKHFLKWISRYWLVGLNSSQMIFDGGRDFYQLEATWAEFLEASGIYQQQVLTAIREVEDALNNIEQQNKEAQQLTIAVNASKKATEISLNRYRRGVAIYLEVVENERLQLQTEINLVNLHGALYGSTVQLIKALGGSWTTSSFETLSEKPGGCT